MRAHIPPLSALLVLGVIALGGGCHRGRPAAPAIPEIVLEVHNNSFFEVNVYGLPTPYGPRVRLGTARSFATTMLPVSSSAWRSGGSLVLTLHGIGTNRWWTTPELPLGSGMTPCLDIYSDATGDLSRSSFYSVVAADSLAGRRSACGFMIAAVR